jgi:hypothetical protein
MTAVKVILRKKFNTRKINAWFKKNEEKLAKLALAGLLSVPVLILLVILYLTQLKKLIIFPCMTEYNW